MSNIETTSSQSAEEKKQLQNTIRREKTPPSTDLEGIIEPANAITQTKVVNHQNLTSNEKSENDKFSMPMSYEDRFLITKTKKGQELFRSHSDESPAIIDNGDKLRTRHADRATAIDMVELAAHRGWSSLNVKGPEDFRREMWIEASAMGINVKGYKPNEKDIAEASRRSELMSDRVIERIDDPKVKDQNNIVAFKARSKSENDNDLKPADYKEGVSGKIVAIGTAPYKDREGAAETPFISLDRGNGNTHQIWGVGLPDMVQKNNLSVGDKVTIFSSGTKQVTIEDKDKETGEIKEKTVHRRDWDAKNIERSSDKNHKVAAKDDKVSDRSSSESQSLAKKIREPNAVHDPTLRGMASKLALMEYELRQKGVSPREILVARENASSQMAKNHIQGKKYSVEKLPNTNVTLREQGKAFERSSAKGTINPQKMTNPIEKEKQLDKDQGRSR